MQFFRIWQILHMHFFLSPSYSTIGRYTSKILFRSIDQLAQTDLQPITSKSDKTYRQVHLLPIALYTGRYFF
jgi:hypothetical protein